MPTIAIALVALAAAADADFGWPDSIASAAQDATELPDPQRLRTLERLTARAGERALPVLVPLLSDRDPSIRLFAARRLGRAGVAGRRRGGDALDLFAQRPARRSPVRARRAARGPQRCRTPRARPSSARFAIPTPPSASPRSTRWNGTTRCRRCRRCCRRWMTTAARFACARFGSSPARATPASRCRCSRASMTPTDRSAARQSARWALTRARRPRCFG